MIRRRYDTEQNSFWPVLFPSCSAGTVRWPAKEPFFQPFLHPGSSNDIDSVWPVVVALAQV